VAPTRGGGPKVPFSHGVYVGGGNLVRGRLVVRSPVRRTGAGLSGNLAEAVSLGPPARDRPTADLETPAKKHLARWRGKKERHAWRAKDSWTSGWRSRSMGRRTSSGWPAHRTGGRVLRGHAKVIKMATGNRPPPRARRPSDRVYALGVMLYELIRAPGTAALRGAVPETAPGGPPNTTSGKPPRRIRPKITA